MSTPRTDRFFREEAMNDFAKYPAAKFCAELEAELAAERAKVDKLRDAMGELIEGIDILTPDAPVAIEGTIMGNAKKALSETAPKEDGK